MAYGAITTGAAVEVGTFSSKVTIVNTGTVTVYVGDDTNVLSTTGVPITAGGVGTFDSNMHTWVYSATAGAVRWISSG
jgi:hypothetical protein